MFHGRRVCDLQNEERRNLDGHVLPLNHEKLISLLLHQEVDAVPKDVFTQGTLLE